MRQILTDANESLIALSARSGASGDSNDAEHLTIFSVSEQLVLLIVSDELVNDSVAGVCQGAVLDSKAAVTGGQNHALKEREGFPADDVSLSTCGMEIISLLVTVVPFFLNHN